MHGYMADLNAVVVPVSRATITGFSTAALLVDEGGDDRDREDENRKRHQQQSRGPALARLVDEPGLLNPL